MRRAVAIAVVGWLAASGAALAQAPAPGAMSDTAKAMVGSWEFANADRDRVCTVTFRGDAGPAGPRVEFDRNCAALYPFVKEIVAWRMAENDFLRLLNEQGNNVLEFSEVESGVFEAPRPGEGIMFIQSAGAADPAPRSAEQVAGEYSVMRGAKAICTLSLANTPAGADLSLKIAPPCDALVMRFAPSAWQVERGELILRGVKGQVWRFEEDGEAWRRVPRTADAVSLVRK